MRIPQPPLPKKTPALALKPQLHTHKNHHTYDGAHQLPQSTHVRLIPDHSDNTINNTNPTNRTTTRKTSKTRKTKTKTETDPPAPRYAITLHYAHNRACEIYRTSHDMDILRRALGVLAHPIPSPKEKGSSNSKGSNGSNSTTTTTTTIIITTTSEGRRASSDGPSPSPRPSPAAAAAACKRTCSCPCSCSKTRCEAREAREAAGVQQMLVAALARTGAGDTRVRVAMEWFLRRRMRDCGGR